MKRNDLKGRYSDREESRRLTEVAYAHWTERDLAGRCAWSIYHLAPSWLLRAADALRRRILVRKCAQP